MQYFEQDGLFWLPEKPDRRIPGRLTFSAGELAVQLHGSLFLLEPKEDEVISSSPENVELPVLHGRFHDDREVTLLHVSGTTLKLPFDDGTHEYWRARFVLVGGHATHDEFELALFGFDALAPWASPPAMASETGQRTYSVDMATATVFECDLPVGHLRLLSGAAGNAAHDQVHLDQWCQFELSGDSLPLSDVLHTWIRPLQDFLIVCLGSTVRLTSLFVDMPGGGRLEVFFAAIQPEAGAAPSAASILNYDAPTLITRTTCPIDICDALVGWFQARSRFSDVMTLACGPFYAPFIFSEHRYASTFQSAEALAKELFDSKDVSKPDHKARVEAVRDALSAAALESGTTEWVLRLIQGRNDKPLRTYMQELTESVDRLGEVILSRYGDFPDRVSLARAGVSHGGLYKVGAIERHWLGDLLLWIVRVSLLAQCGVPVAELAARATRKPRISFALDQILAEIAKDAPG